MIKKNNIFRAIIYQDNRNIKFWSERFLKPLSYNFLGLKYFSINQQNRCECGKGSEKSRSADWLSSVITQK